MHNGAVLGLPAEPTVGSLRVREDVIAGPLDAAVASVGAPVSLEEHQDDQTVPVYLGP